jgi:hypothetical protein
LQLGSAFWSSAMPSSVTLVRRSSSSRSEVLPV